jgi:hypothetical protein
LLFLSPHLTYADHLLSTMPTIIAEYDGPMEEIDRQADKNGPKMMGRRTNTTAEPAKRAENNGLAEEMAGRGRP